MPLVTRLEKISSQGWMLYWKRDFAFVAGQVVPLALDPVGPTRLYSLATGENDQEAGILFKTIPGGRITPRLETLNPGDRFWVGKPQGSFVMKKTSAVWVATGTGIAPFLSMVASGYGAGCTLVHGGRTSGEFYFSDKLNRVSSLSYVRCASQESSPEFFPGRVTSYLKSQQVDLQSDYYLCGSAEMVVQARDILVEKGVSFRQIISEVYF